LMEDAHIVGGDPQGAGGGGRQVAARLGRSGFRDFDPARRGAVQTRGPVAHGLAAARLHVVEDLAHYAGDEALGATLRAGQRILAPGGVELIPVDTLHHIIFSMGRTSMADAPSAFSFSSVSQKTASWQTAWTATASSRPDSG